MWQVEHFYFLMGMASGLLIGAGIAGILIYLELSKHGIE